MSAAEILGALGVFLAIIFAAGGVMYNALNGRLCTVEGKAAAHGEQLADIGARLKTIEGVVQEIRVDVRAIRNGK